MGNDAASTCCLSKNIETEISKEGHRGDPTLQEIKMYYEEINHGNS